MRIWILIVTAVFGLAAAARAQQDSVPGADQAHGQVVEFQSEPRETTETVAQPEPGIDHPTLDPLKAAERKKKAMIGLAAIGGIAMTGVAVIAATIIWARRLRRLARDPGPVQTTAGNDFWFLKPSKQLIETSSPAKQQASRDSSAEMDSSE